MAEEMGPAGDTRQRIREVALELFTAQGFEKTSLREIAERLEITKAALYYHFRSKADLIRSLVTPMIDDVDAVLEKARTTDLPPRRLFELTFETLHRHRAVFAALMRDASAFAYVDLEAASQHWIEEIPTVLAGPNATTAERVRAVVAFGGLARAALLTVYSELPLSEVKAAAVDAAYAALMPQGT